MNVADFFTTDFADGPGFESFAIRVIRVIRGPGLIPCSLLKINRRANPGQDLQDGQG